MSVGVGWRNWVRDRPGRSKACRPTQRCRQTTPQAIQTSQLRAGRLWALGLVFCLSGPSIPLTPGDTPIRKREELFDDGDDIMATLGFGDSPKAEKRQMGDQ